jgi:hypothetical protein
VTPTSRISIKHVAAAIKKVQAMDLAQRVSLADEIFIKQPNLLACCLVQPRLGVDMQSVEVLLNILLVCYQAMQETGKRLNSQRRWPEPALAHAARAQYLANHPEQPLLAFVLDQSNTWLRDLARRHAESESDKFVMMASINLVNCIAYADAPPRA